MDAGDSVFAGLGSPAVWTALAGDASGHEDEKSEVGEGEPELVASKCAGQDFSFRIVGGAE